MNPARIDLSFFKDTPEIIHDSHSPKWFELDDMNRFPRKVALYKLCKIHRETEKAIYVSGVRIGSTLPTGAVWIAKKFIIDQQPAEWTGWVSLWIRNPYQGRSKTYFRRKVKRNDALRTTMSLIQSTWRNVWRYQP